MSLLSWTPSIWPLGISFHFLLLNAFTSVCLSLVLLSLCLEEWQVRISIYMTSRGVNSSAKPSTRSVFFDIAVYVTLNVDWQRYVIVELFCCWIRVCIFVHKLLHTYRYAYKSTRHAKMTADRLSTSSRCYWFQLLACGILLISVLQYRECSWFLGVVYVLFHSVFVHSIYFFHYILSLATLLLHQI